MFTDITLENCISVLEVYRGKDKDLLRAEKLLDQLCEKSKKATVKNPVSFANSKELAEVERILKKKFNAKMFELYIYDDVISNTLFGANGFTMPQALASFRPAENGLSKDLNIYVSIGQALINHMDLTGGEVMAIIIHEIGHNVRHDWLRQFADAFYAVCAPPTVLLSELGIFQSMYIKGPKDLEKNAPKVVLQLGKFIGMVKRWILDVSKFSTLGVILKHPTLILRSIDPIGGTLGYIEEKYADSLATSMGYGYEMGTASAKMDDFRRMKITNMKPSPLSIVEDFCVRSAAMLLSPLDVHPQDAVRVSRQITLMRKHLKDPSLTPGQRKELTESLDKLETFIDEIYLNPKHKRNISAPFTFIWNYVVMKLNGYVDLREIFNALRLEE